MNSAGRHYKAVKTREYNIGELANLAGVTRRVVRFYVQRELVPPPGGRGRGSFYTDLHLTRIRKIQKLQAEGLSLDAIGQLLKRAEAKVGVEQALDVVESLRSKDLESALLGENVDAPMHVQRRARYRLEQLADLSFEQLANDSHDNAVFGLADESEAAESEATSSTTAAGEATTLWARVSVVPGIELHIDCQTLADRNGVVLSEDEIYRLKVLIHEYLGGVKRVEN